MGLHIVISAQSQTVHHTSLLPVLKQTIDPFHSSFPSTEDFWEIAL